MALIHERISQLMFDFMVLSPASREEICEWFGAVHNQFGVIGRMANDAIEDGDLDLYVSIMNLVENAIATDGSNTDELEPLLNAYCLSFLHLIYFLGENGSRAWELTPKSIQAEYLHLVGEPYCLSGLAPSETMARYFEIRKRMRMGL